MIPSLRRRYNDSFTQEKFERFTANLQNVYPGQLDFRVAETPLFVPKDFQQMMTEACDYIIELVLSEDYLKKSSAALPPEVPLSSPQGLPHCIAFDFGVCEDEDGNIFPQLIELQGFPSLFAWQVKLPQVHKAVFDWPQNMDVYLGGHTENSYVDALRKLILGDEKQEQVVLLEILPHQQKTRVDFYATQELLGIHILCLTKIIEEEGKLYYEKEGKKIEIRRIYNRVIFDELFTQPKEIQQKGEIFFKDLDVTWVPHPSWFYRISKWTIPFLNHPMVPSTKFLNEVEQLPSDLQNYVVKPLFSFAGQGVIIDLTAEAIKEIKDPENWILQKKVSYAPIIETPTGPAKAEIRLFYLLDPHTNKLKPANNLSRLSKGKMVGVRYNKDKDWVGGSFCLFER